MAKGNFFSFVLGAAFGIGAYLFYKSGEGEKLVGEAKKAAKCVMDKIDAWEEEGALDFGKDD